MGFSSSSDGKESAGNTGDPVLIHGLEISPEESETCSVVSDSLWPHGQPFPPPGDLPGIEPRSPALQADSLPADPQEKAKNTGVGSLSLLQWIFLTQELNWGLLPCRWILYQLDYRGKETATHSCILAWRIPCTEEPGRLKYTGHKKSGMPEQITHMSKMNTNHGGL